MNSTVIYKQINSKLYIEIKPESKLIIRLVVLLFYLAPLLGIIYFIFFVDNDLITVFSEFSMNSIFLYGLFILYIIICYKMIKELYKIEIVAIENGKLNLSNRILFKFQNRDYDINKIKDLKYIDSNNFTDHPLNTKGFDYLGFQTGEKEIQYFIKDANIQFEYETEIIRFGKNLWEDDANEIINKIYSC